MKCPVHPQFLVPCNACLDAIREPDQHCVCGHNVWHEAVKADYPEVIYTCARCGSRPHSKPPAHQIRLP